MKNKRLIASAAVITMLLTGCGANKNTKKDAVTGEKVTSKITDDSLMDGRADMSLDMEIKGTPMEGAGGEMGITGTNGDMSYVSEPQIQPAAGLLTAGEWCDNQNWGFYSNLVTTGRFQFQVYGICPYERVVVHALSAGAAVADAKVRLIGSEGSILAAAVTDYSGTAYLFYNVFEVSQEEPAYVVVESNGVDTMEYLAMEEDFEPSEAPAEPDHMFSVPTEGQMTQEERRDEQQIMTVIRSFELTVEIPEYVERETGLDVMFVFDTTGSMGDELLYLQKEFVDIANRIADQNTRFSVNFYRDNEDEYVVRSNDFTTDFLSAAALINAESASGGGDYEEAVDEALVDAVVHHSWDADNIKLMFLILDAPPHDTPEAAANLKIAVSAAAEMGIRIIPIASSGVDETTEAILRNLAMLTGGTYTFLTNDSGIGENHLEPTIGNYQVEKLNELIIRLIEKYRL